MVTKTIKLAGFANLLHHQETTNHHAALTLQMEAYCQTDPATNKQVAVPAHIPNFIYLDTSNMDDH